MWRERGRGKRERVNLTPQLDGLENHLRDLSLGVCVRAFPERFDWGGKTHPDCVLSCHGLGPQTDYKELEHLIHLSLLSDSGHSVTIWSHS